MDGCSSRADNPLRIEYANCSDSGDNNDSDSGDNNDSGLPDVDGLGPGWVRDSFGAVVELTSVDEITAKKKRVAKISDTERQKRSDKGKGTTRSEDFVDKFYNKRVRIYMLQCFALFFTFCLEKTNTGGGDSKLACTCL